MPSTHSHTLDLLAAELDVMEAEARLAEHEADVLAGLIPPNASRGLLPHERAAGVNFATIDVEARARADRLAERLRSERAWLAGAVDDHLADARTAPDVRARISNLANPGRPLDVDLPGASARMARLEADTLDDLRGSYADGWRQVAGEARAQGLPTRTLDVTTVTGPADSLLAAQAAQVAARPYTTGIDAAAKAAARTTSADPDAIRRAAVTAAREDGLDGLATDHARAPITQAAGAGRQAAAESMPTARTIYASELLDGNTCAPCSLVDGREYATIDDARLDYPSGTYVRCEGGSRCRGTLVFVWDTEVYPTIDTVVRPGPEAPPLGPPPPPDPPPTSPRIGPNLPTPPPPKPAAPLTREEKAAEEKAARLAARRARAAADREAERAAMDELVTVDGYTAEEVAQARKDLDYWRTRAQAEAKRMAQQLRGDLDAATGHAGVKLTNPPVRKRVRDPGSGRLVSKRYNADGTPYTGGEWDWLEQVSDAEDKRLRRDWLTARGERGIAPDELADFMRQTGFISSDASDGEAISYWLDTNRRIDGYDAIAAGKSPSQYAYGGAPDFSLADSPYGHLAGDNADAVRTLLTRYAEEADTFAERALADEAIASADAGGERLPWNMTEDAFADELAVIEARYAEADLTPVVDDDPVLGRPRYADDVEALLSRYAELVPDAFTTLDLAPRDLYRAIYAWAKEAGMTIERFAAS